MISLNVISALAKSSLYGQKLDSGEVTALANQTIPESKEGVKHCNALPPLLNHHDVTQELALTSSIYEGKIAILKTKIEEKKYQFQELVSGQNGLPEEKLDLERALKRMDKLLELPSSTLMAELHEGDENTFDIYFDDVNKLLDLDPRKLNYILASTPIPSEKDILIGLCNHWSESEQVEEAQLKDLFLRLLPNWRIETNNFHVNKDNYFYLPGLPIVIQKTGLPESIKRRFPKDEGKTLSTVDIERLNEVANLIVKSHWREVMKTSLQFTESVHIVQGMTSGGAAGLRGHTLASIEDDIDEYELARIIIHEDYHQALRNNKKFNSALLYEIDKETPPVNHPWVPGGSRAILIEELFTHSTGVSFCYHLLQKELVPEPKITRVVAPIIGYLEQAKQAIELLEKEPQYLNSDGLYLLDKAKEFWYGFEIP